MADTTVVVVSVNIRWLKLWSIFFYLTTNFNFLHIYEEFIPDMSSTIFTTFHIL